MPVCLQDHSASQAPLGEESEKGVRGSGRLAQCRFLCSVKFYMLILLNRHFSRGFALGRVAEPPLTRSSGAWSLGTCPAVASLPLPLASSLLSSAPPYSQHSHKHTAFGFCCLQLWSFPWGRRNDKRPLTFLWQPPWESAPSPTWALGPSLGCQIPRPQLGWAQGPAGDGDRDGSWGVELWDGLGPWSRSCWL